MISSLLSMDSTIAKVDDPEQVTRQEKMFSDIEVEWLGWCQK